jgi:hypothetical protein
MCSWKRESATSCREHRTCRSGAKDASGKQASAHPPFSANSYNRRKILHLKIVSNQRGHIAEDDPTNLVRNGGDAARFSHSRDHTTKTTTGEGMSPRTRNGRGTVTRTAQPLSRGFEEARTAYWGRTSGGRGRRPTRARTSPATSESFLLSVSLNSHLEHVEGRIKIAEARSFEVQNIITSATKATSHSSPPFCTIRSPGRLERGPG